MHSLVLADGSGASFHASDGMVAREWEPWRAGLMVTEQKIDSDVKFLFLFFLDECEEVEHQCQKTIQQLEAILGEPLQSYF